MKINKKQFAYIFGWLFMLAIVITGCKDKNKSSTHIISVRENIKHTLELPKGKRIAFGWKAVGMIPGDTVSLQIEEKLNKKYNWLRLTVAQEIWDEKRIKAFIPEKNIDLGEFDIKYSSVLVPYEIEIPETYIGDINKYGINLVLGAAEPFWFYSGSFGIEDNLGLMPHVLSSNNAVGNIKDFLACFLSTNSVQAFGWREGTVLDGLWQLYNKTGNQLALNTIEKHLNLFFDKQGNLIYENAGSSPNDNHVDGIESTIPFATLARLQPNHPILDTVINGWQHLKKENGMIIDGTMVSAEGCYTVSYPMSVIGKAKKNKKLMQEALDQLKHRFILINDGNFYLRYYTDGGYTYRNWARGAAWFLLGFSCTIEEMGVENVDKEIISKYKEAVDIALSMQREDGLWSCIMHDSINSLPDASGSAGIAAAIMTGINLDILPQYYKNSIGRCYINLQQYITPDGFLKGVAQDNRAGEALQQSDYRVIAQMGMGMLAQLYANLNKDIITY